MYKFYQTSTTENKKVDDPESVKKELLKSSSKKYELNPSQNDDLEIGK